MADINIIQTMNSTATTSSLKHTISNGTAKTNSNGISCFSSIRSSTGIIEQYWNSNQIKHEGEKLDLYLKAIITLLDQKGIKITENEIKEVIDSIKVMDKLMEE